MSDDEQAERPAPSYGTPNWAMIDRWLHLDAADDGPFWALNLMRYRAVAQYTDGPDRGTVSGRDADDAYAPLGPLAAVGAVVAFLGDVADQPLGSPRWDRVGIVRYPSRSAFFAMQQRDDFKAQHVHKEAGMAATIVMACLPDRYLDVATGGDLVLVVERSGPDLVDADRDGEVARFTVEGVIVGDDRTFERVRFVRAADVATRDALVAAAARAAEAHVLVLDPSIDRLVETIADASATGSR